jgi:dTDP-glucose 4,6-dehydratase
MKLLVTGGAGFIGSNFVRHVLEKNDHEITVLDKLTYAGNLENLKDIRDKIGFVEGDICDRKVVNKVMQGCDAVLNFAAETHVDRSIIDGGVFVKTDVLGTYQLLEAARRHDIRRFVQISTDEVYGSIEEGSFKEKDPLTPSNPYSASKASADLLAHSYCITYDLPVIITRSSNNFGPYQHREKLIPKLITNALQNKPLPIYGDGRNFRDWIHVSDNCEAIDRVLFRGKVSEIYNVGTGKERANIEVAKKILRELGKPENLIRFVKDRPGHDRRYAVDCTKIRGLGWEPKTTFEDGLRKTIDWYRENRWWWKTPPGRKNDNGPFD